MVTEKWIRKRKRAIVAIHDLQMLIASYRGQERPLMAKLRNAEIAIFFAEARQRRRRKQR